ncbi:DUF1350 family protein [Phormidesmis sp. 146-35]
MSSSSNSPEKRSLPTITLHTSRPFSLSFTVMNAEFCFRPLSFSWVAIHPQPRGVVQFMGGAFFGTFPTLFYRYLLRRVYEAGYTVIALPFRFSFRHWPLAVGLLKEQDELRREIALTAQQLGYECDLYQDKTRYFWMGHSLGCKYIALLEFLSDDRWPSLLETCTDARQVEQLKHAIADLRPDTVSIKGQPSLLLAPDISNTESAIPIRALAQLLDRLQLCVLPTRKQTQCLIAQSDLFNLTGLISFDRDTIAGSVANPGQKPYTENDVLWLLNQLKQRAFPLLHQELLGKHLEPVGVKIGSFIVDLNPFDKFVKRISDRPLEDNVLQFLKELQQRQQAPNLASNVQSLEGNNSIKNSIKIPVSAVSISQD